MNADDLFLTALDIADPAGRTAYLDHACAGDEPLRREVDSMLAAHERMGGFLQNRPAPLTPAAECGAAVKEFAEKPGDRIGRYKLLEPIGEGGFGVVWMAEQEEPVRRRVALKIIKLGMDTRSVIARFEAERQALALMDHPHIARVFDGGASDAGRPYFVMELVKGIPITKYCEECKLSMRERLELVAQVCRAVQHAHQKGIIHRDLKPSNVLVTEQDGRAVPKVIDFGIAKATEGRLTDKTLFTGFQQWIGTPSYMSPEQAGLASLDIDTRSDVYSLGVLLYELLTGRTPFDTKELMKSGYEAVMRTIRETEPMKPSTRLTQELTTPDVVGRVAPRAPSSREQTSVGGARGATRPAVEPSALNSHRLKELIQQLRGDLDWIVMKCLEKDRARRYETANNLALDLERYLRDEPVLARPPSRLYAFRRLVRRNKVAFAAAAAVLLALVAGLGFSSLALARERAARELARIEAARSGQVARFLKDMLNGVAPSVALGRDTKLLREILDKTAERLDKELKGQPEVEADLRITIGRTYQELGQYAEAKTMIQEALRLRKWLHGEEHQAVADVLNSLGAVLYDQGDLAGAEDVGRQALALSQRLSGPEHPDVAAALNNLGNVLQTRFKLAEAETTHLKALAMRRKLLDKNDPDIARSLNGLANVYHERGDLENAEPRYREALAIFKAAGDEKPIMATVMQNLAILVGRQGDLEAAEATHRDVLALRQRLLTPEHPNVAVTLNELAMVLAMRGQLDEAEARVQEALGLKALKRNNWRYSTTINTLAIVLSKKGDLVAAEASYREALELRKQLLAPDHPMVAESLNGLANLLAARGDLAGAAEALTNTLAIRRKTQGDDHPDLIATLWPLAWVRRQQGDVAQAESLHREALSLSVQRGAYGVGMLMESIYDLTDLLRVQGKFAEAEPLLQEAVDDLQNNRRSANAPFQRRTRERLVRLYEAWGNPEKAAESRRKFNDAPKPPANPQP